MKILITILSLCFSFSYLKASVPEKFEVHSIEVNGRQKIVYSYIPEGYRAVLTVHQSVPLDKWMKSDEGVAFCAKAESYKLALIIANCEENSSNDKESDIAVGEQGQVKNVDDVSSILLDFIIRGAISQNDLYFAVGDESSETFLQFLAEKEFFVDYGFIENDALLDDVIESIKNIRNEEKKLIDIVMAKLSADGKNLIVELPSKIVNHSFDIRIFNDRGSKVFEKLDVLPAGTAIIIDNLSLNTKISNQITIKDCLTGSMQRSKLSVREN